MLSFPRNYRSWILDTVEPVCEIGIDIYHLGSRMSRKLVFELAESAKNSRMTGLLVNRYPDGFFAASWAGEDCGKFLLDNSNYSASSSPQPKRLSSSWGWSQYLPLVRGSSLTFWSPRNYHGTSSIQRVYPSCFVSLQDSCSYTTDKNQKP